MQLGKRFLDNNRFTIRSGANVLRNASRQFALNYRHRTTSLQGASDEETALAERQNNLDVVHHAAQRALVVGVHL